MKILNTEKKKGTVMLTIQAGKEEFSSAYGKVIAEASKTVKVSGFRTGKVPKHILEQNINTDAAKERAIDFLVEDNYTKLVQEASIDPVDYPGWRFDKEDGEGGAIFTLAVEVMPEIKLGKYKGVAVEKNVRKIDEKDIEAYIKALTEDSAKISEVADREAKTGDIAELDIKGSVEGQLKESLSQNSLPILLGDNRIAPGFDVNVEGLALGASKEFTIELPADYFIKEFAGKKADFSVTLKRLAQRDVPVFDDEFAKKISSFASAEEYRSDLRKKFEQAAENEADAQVKDKIIESITGATEIEVPQAMSARETEIMVDELKDTLSRRGLTIDRYLASRKMGLDALRRELSPSAETRVKAKLVLREIAKTEGLEVSQAEIDKEIEDIAKDSGRNASEYRSNEGMIDYIKDYLLRRKALDFAVEHAKIKA